MRSRTRSWACANATSRLLPSPVGRPPRRDTAAPCSAPLQSLRHYYGQLRPCAVHRDCGPLPGPPTWTVPLASRRQVPTFLEAGLNEPADGRQLWGLLLRRLVGDGLRVARQGRRPAMGEAGDRRSMPALSGTARSSAAAPGSEAPVKLISKTMPAGTRRCRTAGTAGMPAAHEVSCRNEARRSGGRRRMANVTIAPPQQGQRRRRWWLASARTAPSSPAR